MRYSVKIMNFLWYLNNWVGFSSRLYNIAFSDQGLPIRIHHVSEEKIAGELLGCAAGVQFVCSTKHGS